MSANFKIAAVVIVYNPNEIEVVDNILRYIEEVDTVIIWQNSPAKFNFPERLDKKIIYMGNKVNEYIAKPLNEVIEWCSSHNIDYLLTMDQDTSWHNFSDFKNYVKNIQDQSVVIFSPNINNSYQPQEDPKEIESTITSASLHRVETVKALGGFRENYQIYWVDSEFCYWARLNGYKVLMLSNYHIDQKFGNAKKITEKIHAANYSPSSYYFLFRNMLWMRREFPSGVSWRTVLYTYRLYLPGIILGESKVIKKLIAIFKATFQGIFSPIELRS